MANSVINIIVKATDKGASSTLKGIGGALGSLGAAGAALGGLAVAGIGAVGIGIGKLALDAVPLQGIQGAFEGIANTFEGGSDRMLEALQDASAGMVSNRDLMATFNEAAQLVGPTFAQQLPDAMGFLGKAAQATGSDMGFMIDSLVKGVGRMSPMILDNLGIQVNLAQATERASEMFGLEADELSKAQLQAGLMDVAIQALATNTANMPEVVGSASQSWESLKTQFANAKDEAGLALLPVFQQVASHLGYWASEVLPLVVDWIQNQFVPALANIYLWIDDNVIPVIVDLAAWLGENLPPLIAKLAEFWQTTLLPALEQVWAFINDPFIPIIEQIAAWLGDTLPPIIQSLADYWLNTLKPALDEVWRFLSVDMMPIWLALGELLEVTLGNAITVLTGLWQNVLLPALTTAWEFIKDKLGPVVDDITGRVGGWKESMGGISGIIQKIADAIKRLADKARELADKLPDWLIPGSPTPFELGLRGIADAARELRRLGPDLEVGFGYGAPGRAPASQITNTNRVEHHYNLTIRSNAPIEPLVQSFEAMRALSV